MRRLIFIDVVAVGVLVGLLAGANDDWATRTVLGAVGALFGAAIGGAVTRLGRSKKALLWESDPIPGMGITSEDVGRQLLARQRPSSVHEAA